MTVEHGLFWTVFAAVLGAILLGGMFFTCLSTYSRMERDGRELDAPLMLYAGMLAPLLVFLAAFYFAIYAH
ncbi:hypothetical protein [Aureimonas leprariae]|uniref:Uncharacterized protein n=1 Tax=Plantimonas leprariae TaxID=2615207 RepID=A0A7V7PPS1_9HYPH|nr:hypothetical protein [Aureimonas leprariae]KAB0680078.1 hypothetical protein F6X38_09720 [Aureimonas leprariae]